MISSPSMVYSSTMFTPRSASRALSCAPSLRSFTFTRRGCVWDRSTRNSNRSCWRWPSCACSYINPTETLKTSGCSWGLPISMPMTSVRNESHVPLVPIIPAIQPSDLNSLKVNMLNVRPCIWGAIPSFISIAACRPPSHLLPARTWPVPLCRICISASFPSWVFLT